MDDRLSLSRRQLFGVAGIVAASGLAAACGTTGTGSSSSSPAPSSQSNDPTAIASDAYVFGYPWC